MGVGSGQGKGWDAGTVADRVFREAGERQVRGGRALFGRVGPRREKPQPTLEEPIEMKNVYILCQSLFERFRNGDYEGAQQAWSAYLKGVTGDKLAGRSDLESTFGSGFRPVFMRGLYYFI